MDYKILTGHRKEYIDGILKTLIRHISQLNQRIEESKKGLDLLQLRKERREMELKDREDSLGISLEETIAIHLNDGWILSGDTIRSDGKWIQKVVRPLDYFKN